MPAVEVMQRKGVEIMSGGEEAQEQLSEADREQCDLTDCTQVTNANEKLRFFMDSETQHCHIRRVKNNCWLSFTNLAKIRFRFQNSTESKSYSMYHL